MSTNKPPALTREGRELVLRADYKTGFSRAAAAIGGRYDVATRTWRFRDTTERATLLLCERYYRIKSVMVS